MSNYNQSLIEDYRQTIERLQQECTEKTNAIIALGEHLKAKEQECEALKSESFTMNSLIIEQEEEIEELKKELDLYKTWYRAKHDDIKNCLGRYYKALEEIEEYLKEECGCECADCLEQGDCHFQDILNIISRAKGR